MAFPTSGLTNNLVHKEGNRAFVYDSTLGVWNQVKENPTLVDSTLQRVIPQRRSDVAFPAGHIIQQSPIARNTRRTQTSSTSETAGFHLFTIRIQKLLVANTRIRIQLNLSLWHQDSYSGFFGVSRTIAGGSQVNYIFENMPGGQGVLMFRDDEQAYGAYVYHWNDEEDITNSVGDSVTYRINVATQSAGYPTRINMGTSTEDTHRAQTGSHGTVWEVAK